MSTQKTALILGGSGGIGRAACEQLARDGFAIALHYFSNASLAQSTMEAIRDNDGRCETFKADLFNENDIRQLVEDVHKTFGAISVIVNSAAVKIPNIPFHAFEWEDMQMQWDINVKASFHLCKYVVPIMEKQGFGKIILLSTLYTEKTPPSELMGYVTTKHALNGFAKALAVELAHKNITVNIVSPGMTETDMVAEVPEEIRRQIALAAPMQRLAQPEDVAGAISYLASEKADYLTGQTIRVNGGQGML